MKPNTHDIRRDQCMLVRRFARRGYDWWWHSFTAHHEVTGEERAFFVEFFLINPASGGAQPHFGLAQDGTRGHKPSYLMVKAGAWGAGGKPGVQLHRFFAWDDVRVTWGTPYAVSAGDCFASETELRGSIAVSEDDAAAHPEWMCDAGSMSWSLTLDKQITFNVGYGAGGLMRALQGFQMYWHAEGIKTAVQGVVELNGERYIVSPQTSYGYADKNWGSDFTTPWVWLSSNNLVSMTTGKKLEHSAFEIGGGRPKVFGIALNRKLLGCFIHEDQQFEFNFSKFWTDSHTQFSCRETDTQIIWHVDQWTRTARLITDVTCEKRDMLLVNYEAPDGEKRHNRLWNGGNGTGRLQLFVKQHGAWQPFDDIHADNIGCEYGEYCEPGWPGPYQG